MIENKIDEDECVMNQTRTPFRLVNRELYVCARKKKQVRYDNEEYIPMMIVEPVTLTGNVVRLEPLQATHLEGLFQAAQDSAIWSFMPYNPSLSVEAMQGWMADALEAQEQGKEMPFVIVQRETDKVVGSTRYLTIVPRDYGLEIGGTWLAREVRRTAVNTECKYLLLRHAFETLGAIRVQFKTDSRNLTSQRAIERLGAVKEGVLRNHMILPDGYRRHSVYYSILDSEWAMVKANLEAKLMLFP